VLAPLLGQGGEVNGAALAIEDITERVRAEERRMLRVRSDAVESLGAGIAHEVRNPLNALSLNLQLLRERLEDPSADRADLLAKADAMIAELRRMDDLVTHLLEVSRGGPPDREERPLDPVVERVVERLRPTAERAGVAVRFSGGSARRLSIDPVRIDGALHNLVRNAIEAAPPGGHVWVSTRDDPFSTVVAVEDDGKGIPPEDRTRIFELFFTRKRGGTGLGLPLARRAIQDHGGELEVLDRPGGGARFLVHLPIGEAPPGERGPAGASSRAGRSGGGA
jgi:two-component system sensor histidine kinase AtoS